MVIFSFSFLKDKPCRKVFSKTRFNTIDGTLKIKLKNAEDVYQKTKKQTN